MNLVSRCSERIRDVLLSVASEILGKTRHESQSPLSPQAEITIERGNLLFEGGAHASQTRFSREHKNAILEEENHDRTGRPVVCPQRGAPQFVIKDDEADSDLSIGSRSFLHRVNDQVRKRQ